MATNLDKLEKRIKKYMENKILNGGNYCIYLRGSWEGYLNFPENSAVETDFFQSNLFWRKVIFMLYKQTVISLYFSVDDIGEHE